ncbi:MAG: hypothetical protein Q9170_006722 [Blastenia crenularia]
MQDRELESCRKRNYLSAETGGLKWTVTGFIRGSLDVQLKVLQALPSLLQNYARDLEGKLLVSIFQVCFLLHASKTAVVSHTAAASLQQLLAFVLERVAIQDDSASSDEPTVIIPIHDSPISVSRAAADAYYVSVILLLFAEDTEDYRWQVLDDICLLTGGKQPNTLHGSSLNTAFGLELIESSLATHIDTTKEHGEQIHVLRTRLMPIIIKNLSEKASFALTVRSMRLLRLLTSRLLEPMVVEMELAISLANNALDPNVSPGWKRALCLEYFRELHDDPKLLRMVYAYYDEQGQRKNLVSDHLAMLVRLAAEKPALIGVGQQYSEADVQYGLSTEQIAAESGGIIGAITSPTMESNLNRPGLNAQWSTVRTPCMELIDKAEPPLLPGTYIYALVLTCINGFSEGLAKFLLPFTAPTDSKPKRKRISASSKQKQQIAGSNDSAEGSESMVNLPFPAQASQQEGNVPINPLSLEGHELYDQICSSASMVEHCWPALLATSSTFLNASLDPGYLHALIRAFQKFTQVAGVLGLATPRDAFLTTLAKHAVPPPSDIANTPVLGGLENQEIDDDDDRSQGEDDPSMAHGAIPRKPKSAKSRLNPTTTRNLLCLRALLNLGIALGPVLQESWTIILECLHQVDVELVALNWQGKRSRPHISQAFAGQAGQEPASGPNEFQIEKDAVETAVSRLFQSTVELPDQAYLQILNCFSTLAYDVSELSNHPDNRLHAVASTGLSPQALEPKHQRFHSVTRSNISKALMTENSVVLLDRMAQIAQYNTARLTRRHYPDSGWSNFIGLFMDHLGSPNINAEVRIIAARRLCELSKHLVSSTIDATIEQQDEVTSRCLNALASAASSLWNSDDTKIVRNCSLDIHAMILEALTSIMEQRGDILRSGWQTVFLIINSAFRDVERPKEDSMGRSPAVPTATTKPPRLIRLSFASLQLICSDFLSSVAERYFSALLDTLFHFCSQDQDLNISLTSITFFRSVSDFLQRDNEDVKHLFVDVAVARCKTEKELVALTDTKGGSIMQSAVWGCLLLHLAHLIIDNRPEVRNSALHTLFGIIDACGDRLDIEAWTLCFRIVFFKLLSATETIYEEKGGTTDKADSSWNDTAILLVQRLSKTFTRASETRHGQNTIPDLWNQLLTHYMGLLSHKGLGLSQAIFDSLADILAKTERRASSDQLPLDSTWAIWRDNNPSMYDSQGLNDNQGALIAYLQYIRHLHGLLDGQFNANQAETVLTNLRLSITNSTPLIYGSDVDEMTTVQKLVLQNLKLIPRTPPEILVTLIREITSLVTLPFQTKKDQVRKGKTYVALSKATMTMLQGLIEEQSDVSNSPIAHLLSLSLGALAVPIDHKYKWQFEGKGIPTWRQATSIALSLLDSGLLRRCGENNSDTHSMWAAIVGVSHGIAAADTDSCDSLPTIAADQAFDLESFSRFTETIIPVLGIMSVPDKTRRTYIQSIFEHSIIHEPHPNDLARPEQDLLDGLRSQHVGRVDDLPPKLRSRMAYVLLDHLFDLVAVHDGSAERVKLAQAAAPYLILRAGLVLKAYVCDQPLRGRMPQPLSQKKEMHYVLKRLVDLDSEPKAFPENMGVQSEHKKHLFLLFGLVTKALKGSWRDQEMSAALRRVLDSMGTDFGF